MWIQSSCYLPNKKRIMKLTVFLLLSLLSLTVNAQITDSISIIAVDNIGNTDTVVFGFADNATVGIDTVLGEKDISSIPLADLDIRLIQRDTITEIFQEWDTGKYDTIWIHGCSGLIKPFSENIDLKNDFRLRTGMMDEHFILMVHGTNYPITVKVIKLWTDYTYIPYCIYDDNLYTILNGNIHHSATIVTIENGEQPTLISFRPWVILNVNQQPKINKIKVYPNPGTDLIKIRLNQQPQESRILQINNVYGVLTDAIMIENEEHLLDISSYPSGIYFIRDNYTTLKFIKR